MKKFCYKCSTEKDTIEFGKNKQHIDGLHTECSLCARKRSTEWNRKTRDKDPEKWRKRNKDNMLKTKYKITLEQYEEMLKMQEYSCKICKSLVPGGPANVFSVDHDHNTGKIRGLLCNDCNLALGKFKDSIKSLSEAIKYLSVK